MANRLNAYAGGFLLAAIIAISFIHLTRDIRDNDFFWHLKSGQWIWEHKAFYERDPFAYMTSSLDSGRARFIFTSYWLSQVFFYLSFLAAGMPGVAISRFLIAGLLFYAMLKLRKGDKLLYLSLLAISFALFLRSYPFERPQLFSFILFAAVLYLLERIKADTGNGPAPFCLPLSMLVWANIHGGYTLGIMIILLNFATEGLKFSHPALRPLSVKVYKRLVAAGVSAIVVSFLNPGTYHAFSKGVLFQPESVIFDNLEFQSTLRIFRMYGDYSILVYWFIVALAVSAIVIDRRKTDITSLALVACTGYFSFTTLRYVAFFIIAAVPVIAGSFSRLRFLNAVRVVMFSASLAIMVLFTAPYAGLETIRSGEWVDDSKFPVRAADFIDDNDLKGNMYNYFNWGGYLIWRLAPGKKVFFDGRTLDGRVYEQTTFIDGAFVDRQSGVPVWKYLLDKYDVNYIVIPCPREGRGLPLCRALARDGGWVPVFYDNTSEVFLRNSELNYEIIRRYSSSR